MESSSGSTFDEVIKVAVIGPEATGKSCLIERFTDVSFEAGAIPPTIGVDFRIRETRRDPNPRT
jgi:GTPase SAR1 family protein